MDLEKPNNYSPTLHFHSIINTILLYMYRQVETNNQFKFTNSIAWHGRIEIFDLVFSLNVYVLYIFHKGQHCTFDMVKFMYLHIFITRQRALLNFYAHTAAFRLYLSKYNDFMIVISHHCSIAVHLSRNSNALISTVLQTYENIDIFS